MRVGEARLLTEIHSDISPDKSEKRTKMGVRCQIRLSPIARPESRDCVVSPEERGSSDLETLCPMTIHGFANQTPRAFMLRFINLPKATVRYNQFFERVSNFVPNDWQDGNAVCFDVCVREGVIGQGPKVWISHNRLQPGRGRLHLATCRVSAACGRGIGTS